MNPFFKDFGLYNIDIDYIKYLNSIEPEVRYDDSRNYTKKPFLGILFPMEEKKYFQKRRLYMTAKWIPE